MPEAKFEVYNADGTVSISIGSRGLRLLTVADVSGTSGSFNISSGLTEGTAVVGSVGNTDRNHLTTLSSSGDSGSVSFSAEAARGSRVTVMVY